MKQQSSYRFSPCVACLRIMLYHHAPSTPCATAFSLFRPSPDPFWNGYHRRRPLIWLFSSSQVQGSPEYPVVQPPCSNAQTRRYCPGDTLSGHMICTAVVSLDLIFSLALECSALPRLPSLSQLWIASRGIRKAPSPKLCFFASKFRFPPSSAVLNSSSRPSWPLSQFTLLFPLLNILRRIRF
jgi:hypothetical protein